MTANQRSNWKWWTHAIGALLLWSATCSLRADDLPLAPPIEQALEEKLPAAPLEVDDPTLEMESSRPEINDMADFGSGIAPLPWGTPVVCEPPRPCDRLLEAVPNLLTCPNEPLGNCFSRLLCSPRVRVPTCLDDYPLGLYPVPCRPPLLVECGEGFLSPGYLSHGIETCTGAVWRPAFWVFGEYRTAVQYADQGAGEPIAEWANRLDLFGQLNLSGTERLLVGLRPLDKEQFDRRVFSSYDFHDGDWIDGLNSQIQTLFFEGDFGELFPYLDPYDVRHLDIGFSAGRMPLLAQQGLLINEDRIDAVTLTRNTLFTNRDLNLRVTGVYSWGSIFRNSPDAGVPNEEDSNSQMVALLTESDFVRSTVNFDTVYIEGDPQHGDLVAFGLSGIQRWEGYFNTYNTSLHVLGSFPLGNETPFAQQGELLFAQTSWTPHHYEDLIYVNAFWAIDQFTSPARGPLMGGPLGQTGILFSSPGLGRVGAPIDVRTNDAVGGSLGYQFFFDDTRQQIIWELGGERETTGLNRGTIATALCYQRAVGQHWILVLEGFGGKQEAVDTSSGARAEMRAKF